MDTNEGINEMQIQVLQLAVGVLLANVPDKPTVRRALENAWSSLEGLQLAYPVSERALESAKKLQTVFLEMLE